jgi:hypothetical protein
MRAPLKLLPQWSKEQLQRIREIERDFHARAFGEELARVNLDLTKAERHRYLAWMRQTARQHRDCKAAGIQRIRPIHSPI